MNNSPFVNLALLETIRARNSGYYIDNFVTFLAVGLKEFTIKDEYDLTDLQDLFIQSINTKVPLSALQLILNRACKKGILVKKDHRYTCVLNKIDKIANPFLKRKDEITEAQDSFFGSFIDETLSKHKITLNRNEAESYFSGFLKRYQLDFINGSSQNSTFIVGGSIKNPDYLISSFIADIYRSRKDIFKHLEKTMRGYLITNYLVIRGNEPEMTNLSGLIVVLDTPLLMGLTGFSGKLRSESCKEMLTLGQSLKASFVVFDHIFTEWESIFHAWANDLRSRNFKAFNSATLGLLKSKGYDAASIETYIPRLKSILENMSVEIIDRPVYESKYTIDEQGLEDHLISNGMTNQNNRLQRDIRAIAGIYSMRKGSSRMHLNQKPAIFVTSNNNLVKEVNSYLSSEISDKSVPITCNDIWLTNLCWMMSPSSCPDLPTNLLVANCFSAIHSDDAFWESFLNRLRRLKKEQKIDAEDYKLVRYEIDLKTCLKEQTVTLGMDFADDTVFEIVHSTKQKILKKKDDEIKTLRQSIDRRDFVIERLAQILSTTTSFTALIALTGGLIYANILFWKHQSSVYYYAASIFLSIMSTLFDFSLWQRRLKFNLWLKNKLKTKITKYMN